MHPIGSLEVLSRVGNELRIGRVIHGLYPHDRSRDGLGVLLSVPNELKLRRRRTDHEHLRCPIERCRNLVKETIHVVRMGLGFRGPLGCRWMCLCGARIVDSSSASGAT